MRRPTPDPAWPPDVCELHRNDVREVWDRSVEPHSYHAYQAQLDYLMSIARQYRPKTILDVGCAQGTLALLLAEQGYSVTAVDIRSQFLDYARSRWETGDVRFLSSNIFDGPPLGTFDLIFANQIIEHLLDPVAFLRTLRTYASPSGKIVITTPNQRYITNRLPSHRQLGDLEVHRDREFSARGEDHFFLYTARELERAFADAGLRLCRFGYFESPWISGHLKVRYLHRWESLLPLLRFADRMTLTLAGSRLGHQMCAVGEAYE